MLVVKKDTEKKLIATLKNLWENQPTYRCLQFRFSTLEDDVAEFHTLLIHHLRGLLSDESAQSYICSDGDIFVITRSLTQKTLETFLTSLAHKLPPALLTPGLAVLYEIGVDWSRLRTMCNKKIEAIQIASRQTKAPSRPSPEKLQKQDALKSMNKDLLSSLAMRRMTRAKPEIMVIEDDPFTQKLVSTTLKKKFALTIADNGAGGLMSYVNKAPDILFLDIGLPDMDGHAVLDKLFTIDPDAYVVMFSGNGDKENVLKAVQRGAKGFIGKPFTQEKLFAYIEKSPFITAKTQKETPYADSYR